MRRCKTDKGTSYWDTVEVSENITLCIDICEPIPIQSLGGNCYFMKMAMTPHPFKNVQMLRTREEAIQSCYDHKAWIRRNNRESGKRVHSGNAKMFLSMIKTLKRMGIKLTTISAHSPESNAATE